MKRQGLEDYLTRLKRDVKTVQQVIDHAFLLYSADQMLESTWETIAVALGKIRDDLFLPITETAYQLVKEEMV